MYTIIKLKESINTNIWGFGYVMTLLGVSMLKVSATDREGYWATSSEHFPHTSGPAPRKEAHRDAARNFFPQPFVGVAG